MRPYLFTKTTHAVEFFNEKQKQKLQFIYCSYNSEKANVIEQSYKQTVSKAIIYIYISNI